MIGSLSGRLVEKNPAEILLEAGGVGYRIRVPLTTYGRLPAVGESLTLSIHTHVREDSLALFGFDHRSERDLFEALIAVPGVGPRLGLALLSHLEPSEMAEAVRSRDTALLSRVPGIGPKTAERLAVELRGVMERLPATAAGGPASQPARRADLISALENLGYRAAQAASIAEKVLAAPGAHDVPVASLIRSALRRLGPGEPGREPAAGKAGSAGRSRPEGAP